MGVRRLSLKRECDRMREKMRWRMICCGEKGLNREKTDEKIKIIEQEVTKENERGEKKREGVRGG